MINQYGWKAEQKLVLDKPEGRAAIVWLSKQLPPCPLAYEKQFKKKEEMMKRKVWELYIIYRSLIAIYQVNRIMAKFNVKAEEGKLKKSILLAVVVVICLLSSISYGSDKKFTEKQMEAVLEYCSASKANFIVKFAVFEYEDGSKEATACAKCRCSENKDTGDYACTVEQVDCSAEEKK